jgi:DNA-binding response OmpR family regulator
MTRILVADDDPDVRAFLTVTLELAGAEVIEAADGWQALGHARRRHVALLLLDVMMPGLDGLQVLTRLRVDPRTQHLPIVLVSALTQRQDAIAGLDAGADDYLTKPIVADELLARVRAALRRAEHQRIRNPLTGLPGNETIVAELERRLRLGTPFALLHIDIDRFKAFNDQYGFVRGDQVLRELGRLLLTIQDETATTRRDRSVAAGAGRSTPAADDPLVDDERGVFVGHVGGDDFVVVCEPDQAEPVATRLCERFDRLAGSFYDERDRRAGVITVLDRQGTERAHAIMSLSVGVALSTDGRFRHSAEVAATAAELKQYVKSRQRSGSDYEIDRRRAPSQREVRPCDEGATGVEPVPGASGQDLGQR